MGVPPLIKLPGDDLANMVASLVGAISDALGSVTLHFPDERVESSLGESWEAGEAFAAWCQLNNLESVAMVLTNSSSCVSCLLGAIRFGLSLVSIPLPPRGADPDWFQSFVESACSLSGATHVLVEEALLPMLPPSRQVQANSFEAVLRDGRNHSVAELDRFKLIQFTSGSTSDPKGVSLDQAKLIANIEAILDRLEVGHGDSSCSWLPLSHDMGLIGMLLSSLVAGGPDRAGKLDTVIIRPESFLRRPARWLSACSEFRSTITSSPNFGLDLAARRPPSRSVDLSSVRICITGGEPVLSGTMEAFAATFEPSGFSSTALCPAYGLAEAALAVAITPPGEHWHAIEVDSSVLGEVAELPSQWKAKLVSAGSPLEGYELRIKSDDSRGQAGELLVRGPSLLQQYSNGTHALDESGWFHTSDLGLLRGENVYVAGRLDDVFLVAGRNVYAIDIEACVSDVVGVRDGRCVAIRSADGGFAIVAEFDRTNCRGAAERRRVIADIKRKVAERVGASPDSVALLRPGSLPMTSSGKVRRSAVQRAFFDGGFADSQSGT